MTSQIGRMTAVEPIARPRRADASVAIDIQKLSLTFDAADAPVLALSDIDLAIRDGEFVRPAAARPRCCA